MNTRKLTHEAENAWKTYKRSNPLMVRKTLAVKDVAYRRGSPDREVWRAELSFDYDFYVAVLAALAGVALFCAAWCRLSRRLCRKHRT